MIVYIYDTNAVNSADDTDLPQAARQRLSTYKSGEAYKRSVCAYRLVGQLFPQGELRFTDKGKPYIEGTDRHIGVSHSGDYVAVCVSDSPCGIDIEKIRDEGYRNLMLRAMTESELSKIHTSADFFRYWTAKEAYAKYTGRGLKGFPIDIEVDDDYVCSVPYMSMIIDDEYMLTVVGEDASEVTVCRAHN